VLLKMTLIQTPKIKVISSHEPVEFFYMPSAPPDPLLRSHLEACVSETPDDERGVDIAAPLPLRQSRGLNGEITRGHPIVPEHIQRRGETSANRPLIVSADGGSKKNAVLSPRHPSVLLGLLPETGETNTGWSEGNVPTDSPLRTYSSPDKERAIHEGDGHIGILRISKSPVVASILRPRYHQILAFPWLPPFWVTMVTQNIIMRN
jgi:hypothetical protein